jgi:hypothetical protein
LGISEVILLENWHMNNTPPNKVVVKPIVVKETTTIIKEVST